MRSLNRNRREIYYALRVGEVANVDEYGNETGESTPSFWGGSNYHGTGSSLGRSTIGDEFDEIEAEMMDECLDEAEAAEWLEDNGYDPSDFDL